jgi:lipoprotein-anchoring transpeptidase ErfK/SrfK
MEPFAARSGKRHQLHWWITSGIAVAFFIWSFDLIPRIRSAATGTVADSKPEADDIFVGDLLDEDWSSELSESILPPDTERASGTSDPLESFIHDDVDEDGTSGVETGRVANASYTVLESDESDHRSRRSPEAVAEYRSLNAVLVDDFEHESAEAAEGISLASLETTQSSADLPSSARTTTNADTVIPAELAERLHAVEAWLEQDQILDAHAELSDIYWKHREYRPLIQERIDETAAVIFSNMDRQFSEPHFVEYGETLESIAKQYDVPWEYLSRLNRVAPQKLQAGQQLKVVRGPFGAVVDLSEYCLTVHAHGWYVNRYVVGIGREQKTPVGRFTVEEKLENPTWYNPDGGIVEADDPENPLGEFWIGLGNHIGIHGTNDPSTIGRAASRGCVHLGESEIAEVFSLLSPGSVVMIRK